MDFLNNHKKDDTSMYSKINLHDCLPNTNIKLCADIVNVNTDTSKVTLFIIWPIVYDKSLLSSYNNMVKPFCM